MHEWSARKVIAGLAPLCPLPVTIGLCVFGVTTVLRQTLTFLGISAKNTVVLLTCQPARLTLKRASLGACRNENFMCTTSVWCFLSLATPLTGPERYVAEPASPAALRLPCPFLYCISPAYFGVSVYPSDRGASPRS
jgi:hypothetical protein